jgi:hypothetical protein
MWPERGVAAAGPGSPTSVGRFGPADTLTAGGAIREVGAAGAGASPPVPVFDGTTAREGAAAGGLALLACISHQLGQFRPSDAW